MLRALRSLMHPARVRRQPGPRWRATLECLEERCVPAGNVLAEQVGTTLTLIGDELDNRIQLLPGSQPNEVVVQGDGTTINGASSQTFTGVDSLVANLGDGNDSLVADGLNLTSSSLDPVPFILNGNAGDDRIELNNCNIHAANAIDMQIYGEQVTGTAGSGTSGNDTIGLTGTSVTAGADGFVGFVSVRLYGETNEGGEVTGGNDTITIANSTFSASAPFFNSVTVEIYGETNTSTGGQSSTIDEGNDNISVSGTTISAVGSPFNFGNSATLTIVGGANTVTSFPGNNTATIGGGNDS